jgi:aspartyl-tRNA(Asn)/glutamyl-tRNA(Gln) amidotransferase subunit C
MDINLDHISKLSKLKFTEEEKAKLAAELPGIIDYIAKLQEVDTNDVDARAYLTDAVNVFRPDEPIVSPEIRQAIVEAFPVKSADALKVPGVFFDSSDPNENGTGRA